jgi:hypothetical protein
MLLSDATYTEILNFQVILCTMLGVIRYMIPALSR